MPDPVRNPVETFARLGYGARGVVYCLVGALALLAAIGSGGRTEGSRGALQTVLAQPFGQFWLILIALGLFGFCAWRILEALTDADKRGSDMKGWGVRGAHLVGGFIYAVWNYAQVVLLALSIAYVSSGILIRLGGIVRRRLRHPGPPPAPEHQLG